MLKINQLKLPIDHTEDDFLAKIRKQLKLDKKDIFIYKILKKSIDARKKPEIYYVYSV